MSMLSLLLSLLLSLPSHAATESKPVARLASLGARMPVVRAAVRTLWQRPQAAAVRSPAIESAKTAAAIGLSSNQEGELRRFWTQEELKGPSLKTTPAAADATRNSLTARALNRLAPITNQKAPAPQTVATPLYAAAAAPAAFHRPSLADAHKWLAWLSSVPAPVKSIAIVTMAIVGNRYLTRAIRAFAEKLSMAPARRARMETITRLSTFAIAAYFAIQAFGNPNDHTGLVADAGSAFLASTLFTAAAGNWITNVAAGIHIVLARTFIEGDVIELKKNTFQILEIGIDKMKVQNMSDLSLPPTFLPYQDFVDELVVVRRRYVRNQMTGLLHRLTQETHEVVKIAPSWIRVGHPLVVGGTLIGAALFWIAPTLGAHMPVLFAFAIGGVTIWVARQVARLVRAWTQSRGIEPGLAQVLRLASLGLVYGLGWTIAFVTAEASLATLAGSYTGILTSVFVSAFGTIRNAIVSLADHPTGGLFSGSKEDGFEPGERLQPHGDPNLAGVYVDRTTRDLILQRDDGKSHVVVSHRYVQAHNLQKLPSKAAAQTQ